MEFICTIDWAVISGVASSIIAGISLIVACKALNKSTKQAEEATKQRKETEQYNRLSIKPLLKPNYRFVPDNPDLQLATYYELQVYLRNYGLGVAKINTVFFYVDDKKINGCKNTNHTAATRVITELSSMQSQTIQLEPVGEMIEPKTEHIILAIRYKIGSEYLNERLHNIERLKIEVEYESLYGEIDNCFFKKKKNNS
nr:hypothetical protein [uncultured Deefgea sp.]